MNTIEWKAFPAPTSLIEKIEAESEPSLDGEISLVDLEILVGMEGIMIFLLEGELYARIGETEGHARLHHFIKSGIGVRSFSWDYYEKA